VSLLVFLINHQLATMLKNIQNFFQFTYKNRLEFTYFSVFLLYYAVRLKIDSIYENVQSSILSEDSRVQWRT